MLFAIRDYLQFRRVGGRYTAFQSDRLQSFYYAQRIPEEVLTELVEYAIILQGSYDSFSSWLIMYLTDSFYSHAIVYRGGGIITHHMTRGTVTEPLSNLYGSGNIFMPISFGGNGGDELAGRREKYAKYSTSHQPKGYNFRKAGFLGLQYLLCINPFGFHYRNWADLGIVLASISAVTWLLGGGAWFAGLAATYWLLVGAVQFYRFRFVRQTTYAEAPEGFFRVGMLVGWVPLWNMAGFQAQMLAVTKHYEDAGVTMKVGKSYATPPHLRMRVKD